MAALAGESELPFLCINVAASKERLAWQREQSARYGLTVIPVAAVVPAPGPVVPAPAVAVVPAVAPARTPAVHAAAAAVRRPPRLDSDHARRGCATTWWLLIAAVRSWRSRGFLAASRPSFSPIGADARPPSPF